MIPFVRARKKQKKKNIRPQHRRPVMSCWWPVKKGGGDVFYSSFGWSAAGSGISSFGAAGLSSVAAGSSFVTSMSEVQRVRLSRSNCMMRVLSL